MFIRKAMNFALTLALTAFVLAPSMGFAQVGKKLDLDQAMGLITPADSLNGAIAKVSLAVGEDHSANFWRGSLGLCDAYKSVGLGCSQLVQAVALKFLYMHGKAPYPYADPKLWTPEMAGALCHSLTGNA